MCPVQSITSDFDRPSKPFQLFSVWK